MMPIVRKGDQVALIATAKKISREELDTAIAFFEKQEWKLTMGEHLFSTHHQFAGRDEDRVADLQWAINHPEIKVIFCARGGYGTLRLIDQLDFSPLKKHPKWIVGYSDITALLNHIYATQGIQGLHSTMPINYSENSEEALSSLLAALSGQELNYELETHPFNKKGTAIGELFGGNLSLLYALNGSKSMPDPKGKILFLEDLDEYLYHIDRMMLNLKRSGILAKIAGLVVGSFTEIKDNPIPYGKNAYEIIAEHCADYTFPVLFNFPAGHQKDNRSLVIGREVEIEVKENESALRQAQGTK